MSKQPAAKAKMEQQKKQSKILLAMDKLIESGAVLLEKTNTYEPLSKFSYNFAKLIVGQFLRQRNHLKVEGLENLPTGGVILASNHQSWVDVFALAVALPVRVHFVAKAMFKTWPIVRHGVKFGGSIFVNRKGDADALSLIVEALQEGKNIAIFPEGTIPGEEDIPRRNRDLKTGLLRGKTGAVRLAIRSKVPIVPVGLSGTEKFLPPEVWPRMELMRLPSQNPITVRFGKPIYYSDYDMKTINNDILHELTDSLMSKISELIDHKSNFVPTKVPRAPRRTHEKIGVLFLHGFTSELGSIKKIVPVLEKENFVYKAPILRGHGTRYPDLIGVTAKDWYVDAEHALIELWDKVDKVVVVGISMGGLVALDLSIRHPGKIAGVVSVAACLKFKDPLARFAKQFSTAIKFWPSPEQYTDETLRIPKTAYQKFPTETFASLYDYSLVMKDEIKNLHIPIRILHSKNDSVVSPVSASIIYASVGSLDREIIWYSKTDHAMLQDLESEAVLKDIMDFIKSFRKEPNENQY